MNLYYTPELKKRTIEKLRNTNIKNKKEKKNSTTLLNCKNAQWQNLETH
jgi:hypothetical protein